MAAMHGNLKARGETCDIGRTPVPEGHRLDCRIWMSRGPRGGCKGGELPGRVMGATDGVDLRGLSAERERLPPADGSSGNPLDDFRPIWPSPAHPDASGAPLQLLCGWGQRCAGVGQRRRHACGSRHGGRQLRRQRRGQRGAAAAPRDQVHGASELLRGKPPVAVHVCEAPDVAEVLSNGRAPNRQTHRSKFATPVEHCVCGALSAAPAIAPNILKQCSWPMSSGTLHPQENAKEKASLEQCRGPRVPRA